MKDDISLVLQKLHSGVQIGINSGIFILKSIPQRVVFQRLAPLVLAMDEVFVDESMSIIKEK